MAIKQNAKVFKPIFLCDPESIERLLSIAYKVIRVAMAYIKFWDLLEKRPGKKTPVFLRGTVTTGVPILSGKIVVTTPRT